MTGFAEERMLLDDLWKAQDEFRKRRDWVSLHWVLDLAFEEDRSRMRKDHSQQNFVVLPTNCATRLWKS